MAGGDFLTSVTVREARQDDAQAVRQVHTRAFDSPTEAELVERLIAEGQAAISLVAVVDAQVIGHVLFSPLEVSGTPRPPWMISLAPLAVLPEWQRQGAGTRLVEEGIRFASQAGVDAIIVVGHPEYYRRFGFSADLAELVSSPYSGPASMAIELTPGAIKSAAGADVRYPDAFSQLS
jgi:putative acetyltransferase